MTGSHLCECPRAHISPHKGERWGEAAIFEMRFCSNLNRMKGSLQQFSLRKQEVAENRSYLLGSVVACSNSANKACYV